MIQHVCLIVAEIADGILAEMRVVEGQNFEVRQAVKVEHFFEATDFVAADVEVCQGDQIVQTSLDGIYLIASNPQLFQASKVIQIFDCFYLVITNPQRLKVHQAV